MHFVDVTVVVITIVTVILILIDSPQTLEPSTSKPQPPQTLNPNLRAHSES